MTYNNVTSQRPTASLAPRDSVFSRTLAKLEMHGAMGLRSGLRLKTLLQGMHERANASTNIGEKVKEASSSKL